MLPDDLAKTLAACALAASAAWGCASGAGRPPVGAARAGADAAPSAPASDAQRDAMLAEAFDVARQFPDRPFIKDRARVEGKVVEACLARGKVADAEAYAERSCFTWVRAESMARIAERRAADGDAAAARAAADRALVELGRLEEVPDWAVDRVRAQVARVLLRLGEPGRAASLLDAEVPALEASYAAFRAEVASPGELDACADGFDKAIATQNFDLARSGLDGYHAILRRRDADASRRDRALRALDAGIPGLPVDLQVEYRLRTADALDAVGLRAEALDQARRAAQAFAAAGFHPEDRALVGAPAAAAVVRLGDRAAGLAMLDELEDEYRRRSGEIVDIWRARALRAMAEARAASGDAARALSLYGDALEAGALNPNARPRAEDLCATCISLASSGVPVTDCMRARIAAIRGGLVDPW